VAGVLGLVLLERRAISTAVGALARVTVAGGVGKALVGDNTVIGHPLPDRVHHATVATHVGGVTRDKVLGGENNINSAVGLDAEAVRKSLGGTESPARTTTKLVADGVDASVPLGARVESSGEVITNVSKRNTGFKNSFIRGFLIKDGSLKKSLNLTNGKIGKLVHASFPSATVGVNLVDEVLGDGKVTVVSGGKSHEES
jgi:hypothetical protein